MGKKRVKIPLLGLFTTLRTSQTSMLGMTTLQTVLKINYVVVYARVSGAF